MNALDGAGVVLPEERIVRLMGNVRHLPGAAPSMSRQFRGTVAVNRDVLADAIVRTATDKHPGRIEFTRGVGVTDVDFASRIAVFGPSSSEFQGEESTVSEPYDLLVAADGVNSAVRSMLATAGDLTVTQNADEMMFKSVKLPPQKSGGSSTGESSNGKMTMAERTKYKERTKCFHTWPRGLVSMLAPPDPAGTLSAVVILPGGAHAGASVNKGDKDGGKSKRWTWDAVNDEESIRSLFADKFPDAFNGDPVPDEACAQITAQSPRPGGITTICSRLTAKDGSVALIGDAAHSVWPSLGQGANCALETAQYLAAAIESKPQDVPSALEYFDAVRTPQVHACGRLSEAGFGGTAKRAGNFLFFMKIGALALLHKTMPFFFDKPALANINDPAWAYDDVEDAVGQETQALAAFGGVSLAAIFGVSVFGWNAFVGFVFGAVKAVALGEGTRADEGAALVALGAAAAMTGLFKWLAKRRKERRKGNMSPAVFVSPGDIKTSSAGSAAA
jgi:kynurenine 3-monooxygenase